MIEITNKETIYKEYKYIWMKKNIWMVMEK